MAALKAVVSSKGLQLPRVFGVFCIDRRYTHDVVKDQTDNLAAFKRGKGGRGSFSGIVATVFGSSGYFGRYVVNHLAKIGSQIICPYRGDPYWMRDLKLAGELGQVLFLPYELRDEDSIRKCLKYSNVVVNLVGRDYETKSYTYNDVHVDGARRLARLASECGVEKFVHVSHLNAQPNPPSIYVRGGSKFLISKYQGEIAVREEFPDAIIMRPSDIFGQEDRFLRYYASSWRQSNGTMPLWKKGEKTIKQPVFLSDVAEGIVKALQDPTAVGGTYECVGPKAYFLADLVDYFYRCMRYDGVRKTHITPFFKLRARLNSLMPTKPTLSMDRLDREHISDVLNNYPTLEDLGVKLTKLEDRAPHDLRIYRAYAYYDESVGDFPDPVPPPYIS